MEVSLNPEDMVSGLTSSVIKQKYDSVGGSGLGATGSQGSAADFSDLVAEHASKQAKKRSKDAKKQKEFKF